VSDWEIAAGFALWGFATFVHGFTSGLRASRRKRRHVDSVNRQIRSGALRTETEPPQQIGHPDG